MEFMASNRIRMGRYGLELLVTHMIGEMMHCIPACHFEIPLDLSSRLME